MEPLASNDLVHVFHATAFVENVSLKDLAAVYPEARRRPHELFSSRRGGAVFIYPFGAIVFRDCRRRCASASSTGCAARVRA